MCFYYHSAIERATCELHVDWQRFFVFIFEKKKAFEFSEEPDTVVKK